MRRFCSIRAALLATASLMAVPAAAQTATPATQAAASSTQDGSATTDESQGGDIVVTGQTTRNRPLITASADITLADRAAIDRKAPRAVADLLELVPGIFVEGTAGAVSNNYSVRGLQGGGQRFVQLQEDGLPITYGGGGADFYFDNDLTIDRLEAVKGGSSVVLTVNGAGATINFISKSPNFKEPEAIARVTAYDYGMRRGDFYYSQPLSSNLAFNIGGSIQSNPGVRKNPFDYAGWRLKGSLEYRFNDDGYIRITAKGSDVENAYYAGQPYQLVDGEIQGVAGLGTQYSNIGGDAFANIAVPVSTFAHPSGFRDFNFRDGVKVKTAQIRLDIEKPISDSLRLFARTRYFDFTYDFNGLFPGSGTGNAGLTSAVNYLTPGAVSPINNLLTLGAQAYPTATRFGIKNLKTGVIIGSNQTSELNALNGNGFLQRTTLNHDYNNSREFALNAGGTWSIESGSVKNSLTAGVMYYKTRGRQDQSATASVLNDVKTNSDIYDVVALDTANQVVGVLSNNGLVSYGDWGAGIRGGESSNVSLYVNDEFAIGDLRIDGGVRWENMAATGFEGQAAATNQPVQPGVGGVLRTVGSTYNGVNLANNGVNGVNKGSNAEAAYTLGVNYLFTPNLAVYARYANGYQSGGVNSAARIELYEAGVRFQYGRFVSGSVTAFRTNFRNQNYNFADPTNPTVQANINADLRTNGVEVDVLLRPTAWFSVDLQGVFQDPKLLNLQINGANQEGFEGNRPERTPATLFTITPALQLPNGAGEFYGRYKYIGQIFADAGNGVALPGYGVTSVGITLNLSDRMQLNLNADNVFNVLGLTEGNPRQGQTQAITDGFFYARGIVGTTFGGSLTFRF